MSQDKRAEYMRKYTADNRVSINERRRARRAERVLAGDNVLELARARNARYHAVNRDAVNARSKERNWNYSQEAGATKRAKHHDNHPAKVVLRQVKYRAKKAGLEFDLTDEWYYSEVAKGCAATGLPLDANRSKTPWAPHIDRITPALGYVVSNCRIVCACFNQAKGSWTDGDVAVMASAFLSARPAMEDAA